MKILIVILSLALAWGIYSNTELRSENLALHNTVDKVIVSFTNDNIKTESQLRKIREEANKK